MRLIDKRVINFLVIFVLTFITFGWTFFIFHRFSVSFHKRDLFLIAFEVASFRTVASFLIFNDYTLSWSKATQKTYLIKTIVNLVAFMFYALWLYGTIPLAFLISELFFYLFAINFMVYVYYFIKNRSSVKKTKEVVIYGAGQAGLKLESEYRNSSYKVKYFIDDSPSLQKRTIDGIRILSKDEAIKTIDTSKIDLLVIAMPSIAKNVIRDIYNDFKPYFETIKILPSLNETLKIDKDFAKQLKNISVEDLLARHPKDLDKKAISNFINNKTVLITGAGGSIGSEISRQCAKYNAKKLILVDHSEFNLYSIAEELSGFDTSFVMQSVVNLDMLDATFEKHKPDIVIHAAAYKHVPLVEDNIEMGIVNNIIGTKNTIDMAIKYKAKKFVLISTDKAVRPTNVMGATKRICELYAQNIKSGDTQIVAVRFGNVLGSSGSVIPKFKAQIESGGPITVTHPDITRYFMLIPEACELVLQAASFGKGGEIFILDMGEPIKIVDLAKKMIELSGRDDVDIEFSGLRKGEKLYEELLLDDTEAITKYSSIMVAKKTFYDMDKLNNDIQKLIKNKNKIEMLTKIVPEFNHQTNEKEN
ncbi:Capsular polysaccharide biosynthesis protein capD1 (putative UDP-sugar epimerase) [Sulfurovum sp. enrichment culture clone C5]|uniref:Capsular polysaccharide biosynthesis protein capD1 (Putative UDP-sugar epimerase) n=1 Tax=Sulfurovum sp. enrichment culture clone C5 TaxID=497650 RepID=A0A0S4XL13_9BACT|nr:Capsular polysaccharide biosynthesis protein capD1 (putative UDP-sugar epimerase) [Sulfurovum sp. enrichment culture clone C5]